jgi:hypothetical protein
MPVPEHFTIRRGRGPSYPALHPQKRDALYKLLGEPKPKKQKKDTTVEAGDALGIDKMLYRVHDPMFRYFNQPTNAS